MVFYPIMKHLNALDATTFSHTPLHLTQTRTYHIQTISRDYSS